MEGNGAIKLKGNVEPVNLLRKGDPTVFAPHAKRNEAGKDSADHGIAYAIAYGP